MHSVVGTRSLWPFTDKSASFLRAVLSFISSPNTCHCHPTASRLRTPYARLPLQVHCLPVSWPEESILDIGWRLWCPRPHRPPGRLMTR